MMLIFVDIIDDDDVVVGCCLVASICCECPHFSFENSTRLRFKWNMPCHSKNMTAFDIC